MEVHGVEVKVVKSVCEAGYDGVVLVTWPADLLPPPPSIADAVNAAIELDQALLQEPALLRCDAVSGRRLVLSPTGPITPYDDVRSVGEAAKVGMERALRAGVRRPILIVQEAAQFKNSPLVTLLGALEALYVPLQLRELAPEKREKAAGLGVLPVSVERAHELVRTAVALETARGVGRDIGGGDPERMCPTLLTEHVQQLFLGTSVSVEVVRGHELLRKEYPLLAAVDRAADTVPRHRGCVIKLTYTGSGTVTHTAMFVGKGVTYDTGGADIKHGGAMLGMSYDKCGAAAVVAFFKLCQLLAPPHLRAVASLGIVRNSVGEESYVSDELIVSRSGKRVRIGNTDAEGRMVMGDLLHEMMERAKTEVSPHIYTIATLTGHAVRAVGPGYTVVMDNHVAREANHAALFRACGDSVADMVEVSTLRREDLATHRGRGGDDVLQALSQPSTAVPRGHQGPAAFLLLVSNLHQENVPYSHLDVAASSGHLPDQPTSAPLLALANYYKLIQC